MDTRLLLLGCSAALALGFAESAGWLVVAAIFFVLAMARLAYSLLID
jgi:hypothetical protein